MNYGTTFCDYVWPQIFKLMTPQKIYEKDVVVTFSKQ